jgi:hypothetical protein
MTCEFGVGADVTDLIPVTNAQSEFGDCADVTDHIAGTDAHGEFHDGAEVMDHIAAIDANTFENFEQSSAEPTNHSGAVIPERGPPIDFSALPPAPEGEEQIITLPDTEMEPPPLTIDRFPFGSPGAALIDVPQDPS